MSGIIYRLSDYQFLHSLLHAITTTSAITTTTTTTTTNNNNNNNNNNFVLIPFSHTRRIPSHSRILFYGVGVNLRQI